MNDAEEIKSALHSLLRPVQVLATGNAIETICRIIDNAPTLAEQVQSYEQKERLYESTRQQSLRDYNADRDKMKAEVEQLKQELARYKGMTEQAKAECTALSKDRHIRREEMQKQVDVLTERERQILGLINARTADKRDKSELQSKIDRSQARVTELSTENNLLLDKYTTLEKRATWDAQRLSEWEAVSVPLHENYNVIDRIEQLWSDLTEFVCSYFLRDAHLESQGSDAFWSGLESLSTWSGQLPVPKSNTAPAKHMRCTIILASMARMFSKELFQPSYLLATDCGLREMLHKQAVDNPSKESALRSLLNGALPGEQEKAFTRRSTSLHHDISLWVAGLLLDSEKDEFAKRLKHIIEEAYEAWCEVRSLTDLIAMSFDVNDFADAPWKGIQFSAKRLTICDPKDQDAQALEDMVLAVFPRAYTIGDNGEYITESSGVAILRSQLHEAVLEMRQLSYGPSTDRDHAGRFRSMRARTMSVNGKAPSSKLPFLDSGGGQRAV